MNLSEMAAFICGKVRKTDNESVAKCKGFINHRYRVVYNKSLWRDALWQFQFTFTPNLASAPESYDSIQMMPNIVDRLVSLRTTDQRIIGVADEHLFRSGIDEFTQSGPPARFGTMAPVVAILPSSYPDGAAVHFAHNPTDDAKTVRATIIDSNGNRITVAHVLTGATTEIFANDIAVIERATKPESDGDMQFLTAVEGESLGVAAAADTAWPIRLPVRLFPTPAAATTFRALVKKKVLPLVNNEDEPELRTVEDAVIALAHGDMLQRERVYSKAQILHAEGLAMIDDLETRHLFQEDQQQQIIPEVGEIAGAVDWGIGSKGYWP